MIVGLFLGKINIPINNNYPLKVWGSWESDPAERTAESVVDP
jgi:hypothetical protein